MKLLSMSEASLHLSASALRFGNNGMQACAGPVRGSWLPKAQRVHVSADCGLDDPVV